MTDLVARLRLEATGGPAAAGPFGQVETALERVGPAAADAGASARRAANDIDHLGNAAKVTAVDFGTLWDASQRDFVGTWSIGASKFIADTGKVQGAAKLTGHEMLNLSRQFADVGVTAAMGMNPMMILVQQGPQIAETFAMAGARGMTFSAVLKNVAASAWAAVAPLAPFIAGAAAAAAVIGGTAALAARALTKENQNLVGSLGLTEKQLQRLKDQGIDTGVTIGDVFKGTFNYIASAAKPLLEPIGKFFSDMLDGMTKGLVTFAKGYVGTSQGAYEAVKATWKMLPAAMGDIAVSAANNVIGAIERMINAAIDKYNRLLPAIRALMTATGNAAGASMIGPMSQVTIGRIDNPNAGAAAQAGPAATEAYKRGFAAGGKAVDGVLDGWGKAILDANKKRVLAAAGEADKPKAGGSRDRGAAPRDMAEERSAQVAQAMAQAMEEELRVRLTLTDDAMERAAIQKQMIAADLAGKQAQIAQQAAAIADAKGIDAAQKQQLVAELGLVEALQARTAAALSQRAEDEARAIVGRQRLELANAEREAQIDLLASEADLTLSASARNVIEQKILEAQQAIERSKLEEVIASAASTEHEKAIAQARLNVLSQIHANEKDQLAQQSRLVDVISEAVDAVDGFKSAFKRHDWAGVFDNLVRTIQTIRTAFETQGMSGGLMTAGSAVASLVGGKTGRAIGNGLGIASMGMSFGAFMGSGAGLAMAGGLGGAIGGAAGAAVANGLLAVGAVAGPLAIAAGALYAAAKIFNIGGKPTNAGAGVDLVTGQITGNKRTQETENAAKAAADAILKGMELVKGSGITPTASVNGVVIGTRDPSQIYLSDGRTVTSAVGNAAEAVDAAMKAILQGATYQSEAQKKAVESALAAGKGFEGVVTALESYAQSQALVKGIDDAIMQLSDPKAWAIEELKRAQQAQRDALKAAADAGNITADEFAAASAKLTTLDGLQLEDTLKRFKDSVEDSAEALKKSLTTSVGDRILELTNPTAYGLKRINDEIDAKIAEAQPLIAAGKLGEDFLGQLEQLRGLEIQSYFANLVDQVDETTRAFQEARPRLLSWLDELRAGPSAELSPKAQREEALRQFQRQLGLAQGGDANAISNITAYADRLLQADRSATSSASARQALRNQVMGQIEGLAAQGAQASPATAILSLQAPLQQLAQASAAERAQSRARPWWSPTCRPCRRCTARPCPRRPTVWSPPTTATPRRWCPRSRPWPTAWPVRSTSWPAGWTARSPRSPATPRPRRPSWPRGSRSWPRPAASRRRR